MAALENGENTKIIDYTSLVRLRIMKVTPPAEECFSICTNESLIGNTVVSGISDIARDPGNRVGYPGFADSAIFDFFQI